jgi:hypothetical protein
MDCELSSCIDNLANRPDLDSYAVVLMQCRLSTINKEAAPEIWRSALCRPLIDPGKPEPAYFDRDLGHGAFALLAVVRLAFRDHHSLAEVVVLLALADCEGTRPKGLVPEVDRRCLCKDCARGCPGKYIFRISLVSASASVLHLEGEIKGRRK